MSQLILFRGKAGVGKSTLSSSVAREMNLTIIQKDDIYDQLGLKETTHQIRNQICEAIIWRVIETNKNNHVSIILDHSYHYPNQIQEVKKRTEDLGITFISILVICSNETIWKNRFNQRSIDPKPNQIITDFELLKQHYGSLETEPLPGELILDSVQSITENKTKAIEYISSF